MQKSFIFSHSCVQSRTEEPSQTQDASRGLRWQCTACAMKVALVVLAGAQWWAERSGSAMTWIFSSRVCRIGIRSAITAGLPRDDTDATPGEVGLR